MWTPNIAAGTSTHQQIGYLFPAGPYYWLMHMVGVPAWVSQRIWLGSILLFAALGVRYLLRTLHVRGPGVPVAMVLFMLTPYILNFADRTSVLLLPMAGLPWMLGLTIRALRDDEGRGWKYPAIFALVVVTVGSINLTALDLRRRRAGAVDRLLGRGDPRDALAPSTDHDSQDRCALVPRVAVVDRGARRRTGRGRQHAAVHRDVPGRRAHVVGRGSPARSRVLVLLRPREARPRVAASDSYVQDLWLIVVSFSIPVLAMFAAAWLRWRHRVFFMLLVVVGVMIAVGGHPYDSPSALGALWKSVVNDSSFGLALRNTPRAVPMIALGFAVLLGVGGERCDRARGRRAASAFAGIVLAGPVDRARGREHAVVARRHPVRQGQL